MKRISLAHAAKTARAICPTPFAQFVRLMPLLALLALFLFVQVTPAHAASCWAAWSSSTAYVGGSQVSYSGANYQAAYWTQGNNPSTSSGPAGSGQPWIPEGSCSGSGGTTPTPTVTPTPTPTPTQSSGCTPTSITPYIQVNGGSWAQTSSATVSAGASVNLGPQPVTGGSWSWTGPNGYTSTSRQIAITVNTTSTYTATYTNTSGCKSTQTFTITVSGTPPPTPTPTSSGCSPTAITPYIQVNGGSWAQTNSATVSAGASVNLGPQPATGGISWSWTGPNGFTSSIRQINVTVNSTSTYTATYVNSCGSASTETFSLTVSTSGGGSSCSGVGSITAGGTTYTPSWCQEFNGAAGPLDTSVWAFDVGGGGWGNNELEVYCGPPGYPGNWSQCPTSFSTSTSPVYIDGNGHLIIQPINSAGTWLSGRVKTEGLENFQYGVIEANIQVPNTTNPGIWPAFWSLGSDFGTGTPWPNCGEADFMENWSPQVLSGPGPGGNNSTIHTTVTSGTGISTRYLFPSGEAADTGFHRYGMIWQPNQIQFYIDNPSTPFVTLTPNNLPAGDTWPFNAPIFLLMNVAVGGTLGGSTSGLSNPQPMVVDYVRYYQ